MGQRAKVVNRFKAKEHDNHIYQPGDVYPAEGYEADPRRIKFLSEVHPRYNKIFLSDVEEIGESDEFPKHIGGGTFELSNGEKVKGKKEAIEAEEALANEV